MKKLNLFLRVARTAVAATEVIIAIIDADKLDAAYIDKAVTGLNIEIRHLVNLFEKAVK